MRRKGKWKQAVALALAATMLCGENGFFALSGMGVQEVQAKEVTEITAIDYFDAANGGEQTQSGVSGVSYGFVMPKFNGKPSQELSLSDVEGDLDLLVDVDGTWKNINDVEYFKFNQTWGWEYQVWSDTANGWICWFKLDETTKLRFQSVSHPDVHLDYTLNLNKLPVLSVSSITNSEGTIRADATGGSATHWGKYIFNGDAGITYEQVKDDLDILVDNHDGKGFVPLLGNAASGFIWDSNFGVYTDGTGGFWFQNIDWSFTLRVQKKDDASVYSDVDVDYTAPDRSSISLSAKDGKTVFNANDAQGNSASVGIVLPMINGTDAVKSDLEHFVYQVCENAVYDSTANSWSGGTWINLQDSQDWLYQDSGYNKYSAAQQWGYFADHVYGLWFQPVLQDTHFRIGYIKDGETEADNWIEYTVIGNPNGNVPDASDLTPITVDNSGEPSGDVTDIPKQDGWELIWNDEFNGDLVDDSKWTNQTGFFIDENDYTTGGWGNSELEYYTDSPENTSVSDGKLKLTLKKEPKTFFDTSNRAAEAYYSSGKLISQDKFSVKYGRVDFRAKLPAGIGIWPAMWMMPNDDIYGGWASSGEIDVFEGRGRLPEIAYGTLHYGSAWPGDLESGDKFDMLKATGSDMTSWHVYSLVWEEGNIKMYVDGICYMKREADSWNSAGAPGNPNAPFDQRFYLIMNLAAGGYFDGLNAPDFDTFTSTDMYVDYVRVYQRPLADGETDEKPDDAALEEAGKTDGVSNGKTDGLYGDYRVGKTVPATGITLSKKELSLTAGTSSEKLSATITPADTTEKNISWKSSDTDVATVSGGVVTAKKAGTATITATVGNVSDTCKVTVTGINVTGLSLTPQTAALQEGETKELKAVVTPLNASNQKIGWSTSNDKVAVVADGIVTAKKAGTAIITATTEDGSFSQTCTITVKGAAVSGIKLSKTTLELKKDAQSKLTVTVLPESAENKNVSWSSSNEKVATVDKAGNVKAVAEGMAVITATTEEGGYAAECTVTVTGNSGEVQRGAKGVERDAEGNVILYVNGTTTAAMVVFKDVFDTEEQAKAVTGINMLGGYGMDKVSEGVFEYNLGKIDPSKYLVYAFNNGIQEQPAYVRVADIPQVGLEQTTAKYKVEYYWQNTDEDGYKKMSEQVGTDEIGAVVNADVTAPEGFHLNAAAAGAKLQGEVDKDGTLVLAVYFDRDQYKINYRVNGGVRTIAAGQYTYGKGIGSLEAPEKEGYRFVGWYTSADFREETKADVISANSIGDITLYAKWEEVVIHVTDVTLNKTALSLKKGASEKLTAIVTPQDAMNAAVNWSTSDSRVAAVSEDGTVTAVQAGTAVVTVTTTDGAKTASCTVTVTEEAKAVDLVTPVKPSEPGKSTDTEKPAQPVTKTYKVTFKSAGGSKVSTQTIKEGANVKKPKNPTRKGYKFAGWYVGKKAYNFKQGVKSNLTLTAKWKQIKVTKVKITGASKQIAAGKKIKLKAVVTPAKAKNRSITWKSSNKKYATVNAKGVVTVKKAGAGKTVTITATAKDGSKKKAAYKIKIMKKAVKKIKLKASKTKVKAGKKVTIKASVTPTKQVNKKLTWKSSNTKYATVNSKGVVTTKKAGKGKTVTITAYATDGSRKKASVKIKITK